MALHSLYEPTGPLLPQLFGVSFRIDFFFAGFVPEPGNNSGVGRSDDCCSEMDTSIVNYWRNVVIVIKSVCVWGHIHIEVEGVPN